MKKIIALILALSCVFALVACSKEENNEIFDKFNGYLDVSAPTKSVTTTTQTIGNLDLKSTATIVTGSIDGKTVSIYENVYQQLASAEGSNTLEPIEEKSTVKWYYEGKGVNTNKALNADKTDYKWDAAGVNFAGKIGFKLNAKDFASCEYDEVTETLKLTIARENASTVLGSLLYEGQQIDSEVIVTMKAAGGRISSIQLEYTIPAHSLEFEISGGDDYGFVEIESIKMVINSVYTYAVERITLE